MSALLRSGKFLRIVSGLARNATANSPAANQKEPNSLNQFHQNTAQGYKTWNVGNIQSALPLLGTSPAIREEEEEITDFDESSLKPQAYLGAFYDPAVEKEEKEQQLQPSVENKEPQKIIEVTPAIAESSEKTVESTNTSPVPKCETISTQTEEPIETVHSVIPSDLVPMIQFMDTITGTLQIHDLHSACDIFFSQGRVWDLENLVYSSGGCSVEDRKRIYLTTLRCQLSLGLFDRAYDLSVRIMYEGLDFYEFRSLYISAFYPKMANSSEGYSSSESEYSSKKKLKKLLPEVSEPDIQVFRNCEKRCKYLNVTESSVLIEKLVQTERISEAEEVAFAMLSRNTYPLPKIFRFLLNKLAILGRVESMETIGNSLNSKAKKEVSFDNRLCNAYLSAGRGEEFLDSLQSQLNKSLTPESFSSVMDKFPRGGAMGLLETTPNLLDKYSRLAEGYASKGYIAPMNVLWTYYFINGRLDEAQKIWDKSLAPCSQIMFQKVCQTARSNGDIIMAQNLVDLLFRAKVTSGAQGIAYSCLLDVLSSKSEFQKALDSLETALSSGLKLSDINRTALTRLKTGCEAQNIKFNHEVPKKGFSSDEFSEYEDVIPINSDSRTLAVVQ